MADLANDLCGDCFILACFSCLSHVNCNLFMLYSVRVGSRQAVPNKLIWFSNAVLLFVVEWRQNISMVELSHELFCWSLYANLVLKVEFST